MKLNLTIISFLTTLSLSITGCGSSGGSSSNDSGYAPIPYDAVPVSESFKTSILSAVNKARSVPQNCGGEIAPAMNPVVWSDALYRAAKEHSDDMAETGILSHDGSGTASDWTAQVMGLTRGSSNGERMIMNGEDRPTGENAAGTYSADVKEVVDLWLDSPGHCLSLMSPTNTHMGVAVTESSGTDFDYYWTQDFGDHR